MSVAYRGHVCEVEQMHQRVMRTLVQEGQVEGTHTAPPLAVVVAPPPTEAPPQPRPGPGKQGGKQGAGSVPWPRRPGEMAWGLAHEEEKEEEQEGCMHP